MVVVAAAHRSLRVAAAIAVAAVLLAGCSGGGDPSATGPSAPTGAPDPSQLNALMASSDLYVGAPQRVSVGLVLNDGRGVNFGSIDMAFAYVATAEQSPGPDRGPSAVGVYVPTPGTPEGGGTPAATQPSEGRGVYQAEDVSFDRAGFWEVTVTADVDGLGARSASTTFPVLEAAAYPAPGEPALETDNLTIDSTDAPAAAIDSRASEGGEVPDPELHGWTIARAIEEGRPALVIFSTPTFCTSRFCGPVTDVVQDLADRYADRAVFIHVEIWRDYEGQTINQAAADWLYRDGNLTEPWLYLIGADGTIVDRWAVLWREEEVVAALEAMPRMR
jgi:hypothetical protein